MTPGARLAAAMAVLDRVLAGEAAEKALVNWARGSRFAGSGDRHAVRDLVFDALRRMRSAAALGGAETGRGLILGLLRAKGEDVEALFTGEGHAPAPMSAEEAPRQMSELEALDCPDWLAPHLQASLGADFAPVMRLMQDRAPVFLRANLRKGPVARAIAILAQEGITAVAHPLAPTALEVTEGARKVSKSTAFTEGWVELQDAASQAVVAALPLRAGMKVLDYCAGGGGKSLAMAAASDVDLVAYDIDQKRMIDLPARAARAGIKIAVAGKSGPKGEFDLVLADAPCSGSGAWRRSPEARWRFDEARLAELTALQAVVIDAALRSVKVGGVLAYATCSLLQQENRGSVDAALARHTNLSLVKDMHLTPLDGGDGFYLALLKKNG